MASQIRELVKAHNKTRIVIVATAFRSGSTWFGGLLAANGLRGAGRESLAAYLRGATDTAPVESMLQVSSSRFATFKMMPDHRRSFCRVAGIEDSPAGFASVFGDCHWIWLVREDTVGQAVSYWRARATQHWHDRDPAGGLPDYDYGALRSALTQVEQMNEDWAAFFDGTPVRRVTYEEMMKAPRQTLCWLMDWGDAVVTRPTKIQRDEFSQKIRERFEADLKQETVGQGS